MPISLFYNLIDAKGKVSRVEIEIPTATALSNVVTLIPLVAELIQPLVAGGLQSAGFTVEVDVSAGFGPVAGLAADVQEKAEFVFNVAGGFIKRLNIPTILESIFHPGTADVDLGDADVAAFVDFMTDGITAGALIAPVDTRNADVTTLKVARENWGKRRL